MSSATFSLQDAFISYGRADSKAFASKLNDCLAERGLDIWFDFDDIPLGVDYQNQIDDGIERSKNFLLVRPELYRHLGVDPPRGVLLRGPPG